MVSGVNYVIYGCFSATAAGVDSGAELWKEIQSQLLIKKGW